MFLAITEDGWKKDLSIYFKRFYFDFKGFDQNTE